MKLAWVWTEPPTRLAPFDAVLVKAANGSGTTGDGFDFRANCARWRAAVGDAAVIPWTWLYGTTNGTTGAQMLIGSHPNAAAYVMDVEGDDPQAGNLPRVVTDFAAEIRRLRPDARIGFTSYPSRAQATSHGAPWDTLLAVSDFGMPQVYFASQRAQWAQIVADHKGKPVWPAFSPSDDAGWAQLATPCAAKGPVSFWRLAVLAPYLPAISQLPGADMPLTNADIPVIVTAVRQAMANPADPFSGQHLHDMLDGVNTGLLAAIKALPGQVSGGQVDVTALSNQLAATLGPQLAQQLGQALVKGAP